MYQALRAASVILRAVLGDHFAADPELGPLSAGRGGSLQVSLETPDAMRAGSTFRLSVWLYCIVQDDQLRNRPPTRIAPGLEQGPPLPLRLHYLLTPIVANDTAALAGGPEREETLLGLPMQFFHGHPILRQWPAERDRQRADHADRAADAGGDHPRRGIRAPALAAPGVVRGDVRADRQDRYAGVARACRPGPRRASGDRGDGAMTRSMVTLGGRVVTIAIDASPDDADAFDIALAGERERTMHESNHQALTEIHRRHHQPHRE